MRSFALGLSLSMALVALAGAPTLAKPTPKRVVMLVNEQFWAPEYYEPRRIFEQAGFHVTVAGKYPGFVHPDRRNTDYKPVVVDLTYDQVDLSRFDAITFAGGNGAWTDYFPTDSVHTLVRGALQRNMVTGLLCASTGLLGIVGNYNGQAPVAQGRHVTGYFRVEGILRQLGKVNYDPGEPGKPYVVVDGNLITGRDPGSSIAFGKAVAERLLAMP